MNGRQDKAGLEAIPQDLIRLSTERAKAEEQAQLDRSMREHAAQTAREQALQQAAAEHAETKARLEQEYESTRKQIQDRASAETAAADQALAAGKTTANERVEQEKHTVETQAEEARWAVTSVYEGNRKGPKRYYEEFQEQMDGLMQRVHAALGEARIYIRQCGQQIEEGPLMQGLPVDAVFPDPKQAVQEYAVYAERRLAQMKDLGTPAMFRGVQFIGVYFAVLLVAVFPAGFLANFKPALWAIYGVIGTIFPSILLRIWLSHVAQRQLAEALRPICHTAVLAEQAKQKAINMVAIACEQQRLQLKAQKDADLEQIQSNFGPKLAALGRQVKEEVQKYESEHRQRLAEISARRTTGLAEADRKYPRLLAENDAARQARLAAIEEAFSAAGQMSRYHYESAWQALVGRWNDGVTAILKLVRDTQSQAAKYYPSWDPASWADRPPPTALPPFLKLGDFQLDLTKIPQAIPDDPRLKERIPEKIVVPALLPFPTKASILLRAQGAGRVAAVTGMRNLMLRLLTSLPPGTVRFTICDPIGLGQNFAGFMHLADYNDLLVNHRIWTEPQQIEQRLSDITAHMENVIQKYLRNQFQSIEEYNAHAGEIAEPFRFVVVANFPANFTDAAARRLVSIAQTGPRCGVFVIVMADTKLPLPSGFQYKDLEAYATVLRFRDEQAMWQGHAYEDFPLLLDQPPADDRSNALLHMAGKLAKNANRVEVPFDFVAPKVENYWSRDSRSEIDVPLGRAGATKRQHLALGKGTSQHCLIAGKTGSGKSTLLHTLITNTALLYSPDEIEFYLIDFKKGVEFKQYASEKLPHARVVAIESEREFGLSVMQRLDAVLKERGEKYRALGVQDLNGYRQQRPHERMPRILFIVDEFQEFFVEDDKIAQEVSLLLDRLVRQGRAFGIHVLFGSQTLGGNYTLPRSTIGQMAVRIALQCSENDAHLILSEENSAARLLSRPGEAIYNDANGLVEGNNPFQVTWLSDDRREQYLRTLFQMATDRGLNDQPQIVFEGNVPADPTRNHLLGRLLAAAEWPARRAWAEAWLGEAIAIKDPTSAVFRRQSGSHLLLIGQHEDAALAIESVALIALAAQTPPGAGEQDLGGTQFVILDGMPADGLRAGYLGKVARSLGHPAQVVERRKIPDALAALAAEVKKRQELDAGEAPPQYLLIHDLQRFRDLRKSDDDFGFSRGNEDRPPSPDKLLATILREGPSVGIHTIIWCDTLANLQRTFDRGGLREFEMRVLFQMSVNDSSSLIDSPAASKLGQHRALFFSEEQGRLEKFRPYALPSDAWLAEIRACFTARGAAGSDEPVADSGPADRSMTVSG